MTTTPSQNTYSSATATSPAICIPRVFPNITERRIAAIFQKLGLGELVRIDMVQRTSETGDFYRVFIHLAWGNSQNAVTTRAKLEQPNGEVKVVYDDPWFWKLRASNSKGRHVRVARPEPFIDFNAASNCILPDRELVDATFRAILNDEAPSKQEKIDELQAKIAKQRQDVRQEKIDELQAKIAKQRQDVREEQRHLEAAQRTGGAAAV